MSTTALLDSPAARLAPAGAPRHLRAVDAAPAPVPAAVSASATPATGAIPVGTAPRGFALYVGLDELKAAADGVSLSTIVTALRQTLAELAPHAESYATVALAPASAGGRDDHAAGSGAAVGIGGAARRRRTGARTGARA